jgi:hypothetical protein
VQFVNSLKCRQILPPDRPVQDGACHDKPDEIRNQVVKAGSTGRFDVGRAGQIARRYFSASGGNRTGT